MVYPTELPVPYLSWVVELSAKHTQEQDAMTNSAALSGYAAHRPLATAMEIGA
jgi:hypothetical protein